MKLMHGTLRRLALSGALAAAAVLLLAPSSSANPPGGGESPPPAPSGPAVRLHTVGLGARDVSLVPGNAARSVALNPGDAFTVYADSTTEGATVRLTQVVTKTCENSAGVPEPEISTVVSDLTLENWVRPPITQGVSVSTYPWNDSRCGPGFFRDHVRIVMTAQARTPAGQSTSPAVTFTYSPWQQVSDLTVAVPESESGWLPTVTLQRDERADITAQGSISAGGWRPPNGPDGVGQLAPSAEAPCPWCAPLPYPLPGAFKYSLVGNLGDGANGPKFFVGSSVHVIPALTGPSYMWPSFRLNLRPNDNLPGNGSGAFTVRIRVFPPRLPRDGHLPLFAQARTHRAPGASRGP
jgi:hypothetical protein